MMFDYDNFINRLDQEPIHDVIDSLPDDFNDLPLRHKTYFVGLMQLLLGKTANGYNAILKASEGNCDEKMIYEAAAALSSKLGYLSESVYYAKLALTADIKKINRLPFFIGSFEANFKSITDNPLLRRGRHAIKKNDMKGAAELYENLIQFEPENKEAWYGLAIAKDAIGERLSAIKAAMVASIKSIDDHEVEHALWILLRHGYFQGLDEGFLNRLDDAWLAYIQDYIHNFDEHNNLDTQDFKAEQNFRLSDGVANLLDQKPATRLKELSDSLEGANVKRYNILVYCDLAEGQAQASFLLETLGEYMHYRNNVIVFNEVSHDDFMTNLYNSSFSDWVNIADIDTITLMAMFDNYQPDLVVNLHSGQNQHRRPALFHYLQDKEVNIIAKNTKNRLFHDQTIMDCLIIPRSIFTDRFRSQSYKIADDKEWELPPLKDALTNEMLEYIIRAKTDEAFYMPGQNMSLDKEEVGDILREYDIHKALLDVIYLTDTKLDRKKRHFCLDLWGQESHFLDCLNLKIIPDLLLLPHQNRQIGQAPSFMQEIYALLGLEERIATSPEALMALNPIDEETINKVSDHIEILSTPAWRKSSALYFARHIDAIIKQKRNGNSAS